MANLELLEAHPSQVKIEETIQEGFFEAGQELDGLRSGERSQHAWHRPQNGKAIGVPVGVFRIEAVETGGDAGDDIKQIALHPVHRGLDHGDAGLYASTVEEPSFREVVPAVQDDIHLGKDGLESFQFYRLIEDSYRHSWIKVPEGLPGLDHPGHPNPVGSHQELSVEVR